MNDDFVVNVLDKYRKELGKNIAFGDIEHFPGDRFSREYETFRREALEKRFTKYEDWCNRAEKILHLKASEKDRNKLQEAIDKAHLNMSVDGALSLAVVTGFSLFIIGLFLGIFLYVMADPITTAEGTTKPISLFLPLVCMIGGLVLIKPLSNYPLRLASLWRLKATNQMVLCILYVVMYMRHTSNLEHAIKFAGEHIGPPLSLDFRKVLWDVETGKYITIRESLDSYLETWKKYNLEFVESFHLIESSLFESDDQRRLQLLDKSLDVMLEGTYEGMLHYAQDLKNPITMLHMLGVVLPILGLVMFPLVASFMEGLVKWYHLAVLYNVVLPVMVFMIGIGLLVKRPSGYGETDILKSYPHLRKYQKVKMFGFRFDPKIFAIFIGGVIVLFGFVPIIMFYSNPGSDFNVLGVPFLDYKCEDGKCTGPYSVYSMIFSLFVPLGLSLGFALYYRWTTRRLIKIKNRVSVLEKEFAGALFQLGNRVGEGIPVELSFSRVAETLKGTATGRFFNVVDNNIRNSGMDVKNAIFDKVRGAINLYPSSLIESSMKVLVQSARKSPIVVSKSMITISEYVHKIHQVEERLKDLLSDVIGSMKSQVTFLTPMIAGIVVAVSSMIISLINKLGAEFTKLEGGFSGESLGQLSGLTDILNIKDVIPGFHFQVVVGIYVFELAIILTILAVDLEKGIDKISERFYTSTNLFVSVGVYTLVSIIGIIIFNALVASISLGVT